MYSIDTSKENPKTPPKSLIDKWYGDRKRLHLIKVSPSFMKQYRLLGRVIYSYLLYCQRWQLTPSHRHISNELGFARQHVRTKLKALKADGLVSADCTPIKPEERKQELFLWRATDGEWQEGLQYVPVCISGGHLPWTTAVVLFTLYSLAKGKTHIGDQSIKGLAALTKLSWNTIDAAIDGLVMAKLLNKVQGAKDDRFSCVLLEPPGTFREQFAPRVDPTRGAPQVAGNAPSSGNAFPALKGAIELMQGEGIPAALIETQCRLIGNPIPFETWLDIFVAAQGENDRTRFKHCGTLLTWKVQKWIDKFERALSFAPSPDERYNPMEQTRKRPHEKDWLVTNRVKLSADEWTTMRRGLLEEVGPDAIDAVLPTLMGTRSMSSQMPDTRTEPARFVELCKQAAAKGTIPQPDQPQSPASESATACEPAGTAHQEAGLSTCNLAQSELEFINSLRCAVRA